jgi:DNA-binding NtrC family response regulator
LVELKLQVEELRRRVKEPVERVTPIEVGRVAPVEFEEITPRETAVTIVTEPAEKEVDSVVYRPGMAMADVERAAIQAALKETKGNRRKAAENLGIGERTLYRKIKDYELD